MTIKSFIYRLSLLVTTLSGALHASDDSAFWVTLNAPAFQLSERVKTGSSAELRLPDFSELQYYRIGQKFHTKLSEDWTLGSHLAFENSKMSDGDWSHTYRVEMELNPSKIALGANGPKLDLRNRWELRWKEGQGSEIFHRVRQQARLIWNLDHSFFKSYAIGNEVFYETDKDKFTINRFSPITLETNHGDIKGAYYLMYQSKRAGISDDWNGEYVLGASYKF